MADEFPLAELTGTVDRAVRAARRRIAATVEASSTTFSGSAMDDAIRALATADGVLTRLDVDAAVWRRAATHRDAASSARDAIVRAVNDALRGAHAAARGRADGGDHWHHVELAEIGRGLDRALEQISQDLARATSRPSR